MNFRTAAAALILTVAVGAPLSGVSHAQGDLDCNDFTFQEEAQAVLNEDRRDPHRLDADRDGTACEALPSRNDVGTATRTPALPATPSPTQPGRQAPTAAPTRPAPAGTGGAAGTGSTTEVVYGLGLTASAVGLTAGYVAVRLHRRSTGR